MSIVRVVFGLCLSVALVSAAAPSFALDPNDSHWCRNGSFPSDPSPIAVMKAKAAPRTYFRNDGGMTDGCPAKDSCKSGYVLPNQEVLVSKRMGNYLCAFYPSKLGGTAGWIPQTELTSLPGPKNPSLSDWAGKWLDGEDNISIEVHGAELAADGTAYWHGSDPSQENDGGFSASAKPNGAEVHFVDTDCKVTARLVGRYLVVFDNGECGGMNVRADGVYLRK